MVWQDYTVEGDKITLTRQEIQQAYEHFFHEADRFNPHKEGEQTDFRFTLYLGKAEVLADILKMFEPLEG